MSNSTEQSGPGKEIEPTHPRVFVSYSWTSQEHQDFVLRLCAELRGEGVDIILDKWEMKEGHDTYAFMESMVTDPTVCKVLVVSDAKFMENNSFLENGVQKHVAHGQPFLNF